MLLLGILTLICVLSLMSKNISNISYNRIGFLIILFCFILSTNSLNEGFISHSDTGIYNGLWQISLFNKSFYTFIYFIALLVMLFSEKINLNPEDSMSYNSYQADESKIHKINLKDTPLGVTLRAKNEYSLFILLNCLGMISLISSFDLISFFLAIELQSFSLYVMSTIYKDSESSTSAGLKYFLLGALSSGFILLGSSLLYGMTGITHFDYFNMLSFTENANQIEIPIFILLAGLLFKISAAPFHNWAPDVYDGVPTIITSWIIILPKISIVVFLITFLGLFSNCTNDFEILTQNENVLQNNIFNILAPLNWNFFIWISASFSLIIGSILGLGQYRIKRLLAYSAISHIGFILLGMNSNLSFESTIFYLIQYSLINVNIFCFLRIIDTHNNTPIQFISELKGYFKHNPLLGLSFTLCLFSMAGIPPCIGFFAKLEILNLIIKNGLYFISILAILTSVIGTVYYLKLIQFINFYDQKTFNIKNPTGHPADISIFNENLKSGSKHYIYIHALIISVITLFNILFLLDYTLIFNSIQLLQLKVFHLNESIFY